MNIAKGTYSSVHVLVSACLIPPEVFMLRLGECGCRYKNRGVTEMSIWSQMPVAHICARVKGIRSTQHLPMFGSGDRHINPQSWTIVS